MTAAGTAAFDLSQAWLEGPRSRQEWHFPVSGLRAMSSAEGLEDWEHFSYWRGWGPQRLLIVVGAEAWLLGVGKGVARAVWAPCAQPG